MAHSEQRVELLHTAHMLETDALFGVDFVPRYGRAAATPNSELEDLAEELDGADFQINSRQSTPTAVVEAKPASPKPSDAAANHPQSADEKSRLLASIRADHDAHCPHCTSVTDYTQTVFGDGNPDARLMFIGEAPGEEEDRTGMPFVGRAGQKLNDIISAMGLKREDVYIANILKARPPGNRTPLQQEVERCAPFLVKQIRAIQPDVIVTLGGPATKFLLQTERGITSIRGIWGQYVDDDLVIPVMPTFHPAYLLRAYTVENRQKVWSDMQAVLEKLKELRNG
ncbi:MAG TPA: uracil-DNA glycosylase [Phycisphaerales bacterium]|nr:uracil-DNA glycosylase [Phycisphaerales bacterium]